MDRLAQQIELRDGRALGFAEFGNSDGSPVFFCHGFPGSRLDWQLFDPEGQIAASANVRIIAVDRPGMGLSDFQRNRSLLDWPEDITELADNLGLDQFSILGISGGGPYAFACAYRLVPRIKTTTILCGMGPVDAPGTKEGNSWTFSSKPGFIRILLLWLMKLGLNKDPDRFKSQVLASVPEVDRNLLAEHPRTMDGIIVSWNEAFRNGIKGVNAEATLYKKNWSFQLADIEGPVRLWYGDQDTNVLPSVGQFAGSMIQNGELKMIEGEGHFSLPFNYLEEVLTSMER